LIHITVVARLACDRVPAHRRNHRAERLLLIVVPAHLVWFAERRRQDSVVVSQRYLPGVFQAAWWSASTLLTQAEQMPRRSLGRALAVLWMFSGVVFVALYTADLTAERTVQEIRGEINGPEDLPARRVAALAGSLSEGILRQSNAQVVAVARPVDGYQALMSGKADAVLGAAPALRYYASHDGKGLVRLVGPEFDRRAIALVFPNGSRLRKQVNAALLGMEEDGTYERIYSKWFGNEE
jgi:polar amino acid transport system substrate-binding protein